MKIKAVVFEIPKFGKNSEMHVKETVMRKTAFFVMPAVLALVLVLAGCDMPDNGGRGKGGNGGDTDGPDIPGGGGDTGVPGLPGINEPATGLPSIEPGDGGIHVLFPDWIDNFTEKEFRDAQWEWTEVDDGGNSLADKGVKFAELEKGMLSFKIGTPNSNGLEPISEWAGLPAEYISIDNSKARFALVDDLEFEASLPTSGDITHRDAEIDVYQIAGEYELNDETGLGWERLSFISLLYVNADVTVSSRMYTNSGKETENDGQEYTYTWTCNAFTVALKKGWNLVQSDVRYDFGEHHDDGIISIKIADKNVPWSISGIGSGRSTTDGKTRARDLHPRMGSFARR